MAINIVTANIKSNPLMRQSRVEHDIAAVSKLGDVILWQEIEPTRYKNAVTRLLPAANWTTVNLETETPISLNKKYWKVIDFGVQKTHTGRKFVSPTRYISWVIAQRVGSAKIVVFINTHFISSAWSNRHPATKKWRRVRWNHHYKILDQMVERFVNAGYTVVGGGDWNRGATPKFISTQRWLATGGIDHLFTVEVPENCTVELHESHHKAGLYTDHQPRIANVSFIKSKEFSSPAIRPSFRDLQTLHS